jgi:hypothetical protein
MEQIILALLDGSSVNKAEAALRAAETRPDHYLAELAQVLQHPTPEVRKMAAVVLRRNITNPTSSETSWALAADASRSTMMLCIIHLLEHEGDLTVLNSLAFLAAVICVWWDEQAEERENPALAAATQWPQMAAKVGEWLRSQNPAHQYAMLHFTTTLVEYTAELSAIPHSTEIVSALPSLMASPASQVSIAAMELATTVLLFCSPEQIPTLSALVPTITQALIGVMSRGEADAAENALQQLISLVDQRAVVFKEYTVELANTMVAIASNASVPADLRHPAIECIVTLAERTPKRVRKLIPTIFRDVFQLLTSMSHDTTQTDEEWEAVDSLDDAGAFEDSPEVEVAEGAFDRLSRALGLSVVLPVLQESLPRLASSPTWQDRFAALIIISLTAEGLAPMVTHPQMQWLVEVALSAKADPHPRVRWAVANALGQMSTDFTDKNFGELFHAQVAPTLLALCADPVARVAGHGAAALVNFCDETDSATLLQYADGILTAVVSLLVGSRRLCQEHAITVISAVADTVRSKFATYYDRFMPGLKSMLISCDKGTDANKPLVAKVVEAISLIGIAVGKQIFASDAHEVMAVILSEQVQAGRDESEMLRLYLAQAYGRIARVLREDFARYLPAVVPQLLEIASQDTDLITYDEDDEDMPDAENNDVVDLGGGVKLFIPSSLLEEKANALQIIALLLEMLPAAFQSNQEFIKAATEVATNGLTEFASPSVRAHAARVCGHLMACMQGTARFAAQTTNLLLAKLVEALSSEEEAEVIVAILSALTLFVEHAHPQLVLRHMDQFVLAPAVGCFDIAKRVSSETVADDENDEAGTSSHADLAELTERAREATVSYVLIIREIVSLTGKALTTLKDAFWPKYQQSILPHVSQWLAALAVPAQDETAASLANELAVCATTCLVDMIQAITPAAAGTVGSVFQQLMTTLLNLTQNLHDELRQVAFFLLGLVASEPVTAPILAPFASQLVEVARACVDAEAALATKASARARDNALSCVFHVLTGHESVRTAVPDAAPLWAWCLPRMATITHDNAELTACVSMVIGALSTPASQAVLGAGPEAAAYIVRAFVQATASEAIAEADKPNAAMCLRSLLQTFPAAASLIVSGPQPLEPMSEAHQAILKSLME